MAESHGALVADVLLAEELGFDLVAIQDHPYQRRFLDTWTLLCVIAGRTSRIGLATDVVCLPLRPPAVLAKAALSLGVLSGGRFDLGLGAGAYWDAVAAMGGPRRTPAEAVGALEDAIRILRLMWSGERSVSFEGMHYSIDGVHPGPAPTRPIGIWLGAYGPRMLALTGRLADGWLPSSPYAPPERLGEMQARIDEAAGAAGRDPGEIRRLYNIDPSIEADQLVSLVCDTGIDTFILWAQDETPDVLLRRFAGKVIPQVHEAVAAHRRAAR